MSQDDVLILEPWEPKGESLRIVMEARDFAEVEKPVTVRQVFYHLVSVGIISNTELRYKNLIQKTRKNKLRLNHRARA